MNNNETMNIEFQALTEETTETQEITQTQEVTETEAASAQTAQQPVRVEELTQLSTENCRVYSMSDGSQQAVFYGEASPLLARSIVSAAAPMTTYSWNGSEMSQNTAHTVGITVAEDTAQVNRMYLHFDMPTLPRNPRIKKAELTLHQSAVTNEADAIPKLALYRVTEDIAAGTVAPASDTVLLDYEPAKLTEDGTAQYTFDITRLVDMVNGGDSTAQNLVVQLLDESGAVNSNVTLFGYGAASAPTISITYESGYAVGGNYRTHTHQLGRFGQGSIDLARGNLMFECEDFAWGGSRMPITVRHLYNSALSDYAYTADSAIKLDTADFSAMGLGKGWKLNLMQSMVPTTFQHEGTLYENGYVHTDENGQETHFKLTDGTQYESVDDSECIYDSETRTLTLGDETHLFDEAGRLTRITDAYGNTMDLTWSEGRLVSVTDGIDRSFSLTYGADNYLTAITAPDGSIISYEYTDELLTQITYPDGRKAQITYTANKPTAVLLQDTQGSDLYKAEYGFTGEQLASVSEFGVEDGVFVPGAATAYSYSVAAKRTVAQTTEPADTADGETDNAVINTVYSFDADGNVVGEYVYSQDMDKVGVDGSAASGIHPYYGEGGISTIGVSQNVLVSHDQEKYGTWDKMSNNSQEFFASGGGKEEKYSMYGQRFGMMQSNDSACVANGIYQTVLAKKGWNTFSLYARPRYTFTGENDPGAYLRVTDSTGNILAESERLCEYNGKYTRLTASFCVDSDQSVQAQILVNGKGQLFIDAAQFEHNAFASDYNLLENGNFGILNQAWAKTDGAEYNADTYFDYPNSMCITGDLSNERNINQTVPVRQARSTRETYSLSGWAKGVGLSVHEREGVDLPTYRLRAVITYNDADYEDTSTETFTADFSPSTEDWQYVSLQFAKSKYRTIGSVQVYCDFDYNSGSVCFDDIQLVCNSVEMDLTVEDFPEEDLGVETASEEVETEETASFAEVVDAFGNTLTETTFTDGEFGTVYRSFGYDEEGNDLIRETDARGMVTTYTVDPHTSRNKAVTDRCGNQTCYEYDENGRTTKVTGKDAEGVEQANVSYGYDAFDNLTEIVRGDGLKYVLGYNAFHNLESIGVDGKGESLVKYTYKNNNGRLKAVTYANGDTMKASYNAMGQMVAEKWYNTAEELTAHYQYTYDNQGNIVRSVDILGLKEYIYTYEAGNLTHGREYDITLDENGLIASRTLFDEVRYTYDSQGRLTKKLMLTTDGGRVFYYEYPEDGSIVQRFYNTLTSHSKTDSFGRKEFEEVQTGGGFISRQFAYHAGAVTQEHEDNDKLKSSATTNLVSQIILSDGRTLSYAYDAEERIIAVVETAEVNGEPVTTTTEYTYDAQGQLLTETVDGVVVNEMTYDGYGNILTKNGKTYTYSDSVWKDKLTGFDGKTITYDAQGNPTNYLGYELTWEKGRQLKSFGTNTYTYNANGIRTSKTVNGEKHTYFLEGTTILQERWGENKLEATLDNEGQLCGIVYNKIPYFFLKNLQGDIIAITDWHGDVIARYTYDAWGKCTILSDTSEINLAEINPYRYRGYYYDTETSLYYLQSRYYDPEIGRFVNGDQVDLLGVSQTSLSYNLFSYCENDPVNSKDIHGQISAFIAMAIGAVFGLFVQYAIDVLCNWIQNKKNVFKPTSSIWDYITAGLSGALAATGIGKMAAAFAGALITVMNTVANNIAKGKKTSGLDILLSAVVGVISGLIGGSGANLKKVSSVVKVSKAVLKTVVSPKKIAMYLGKIKNAAISTIINGIRYILSAVAGAVGGKGKKYILGLI